MVGRSFRHIPEFGFATTAAGAILFAVLSAFPGEARADIFQFTDADGVIHFTNTRPSDNRYKLYARGGSPRSKSNYAGPVVPPSDRDPARFTRYDDVIRQACALYQIPEQLVRAVIKVESDYDPRAISVSGARGLMQLMPDTAERLQVKDIDDPRENIFGGVRYLRLLANQFNGDLALTVAGYNAGEGAVMNYGGIPPYEQTRNYVVSVTKYYRRYRMVANPADASIATD
ncbi:MAG: transglycosylase SLT domain-containing protein [Polyangiaceae bacterium]